MLHSVKSLHGYTVTAMEAEVGRVADLFFDDASWKIRYLVVHTGHWLPGRKMLITPEVLRQLDLRSKAVRVALTLDQVRHSPDIDTDKPVSRRQEVELHKHYGWPPYWVTAGSGPWPMLVASPVGDSICPAEAAKETNLDPHLRSAREVIGYHLHASDGSIGHIHDFIVDDTSWDVRYMVVDTRNWLPGKKVIIAPQWIVGGIFWAKREVNLGMTRESIRNSPEFVPTASVNREYEVRLYDYYGRPAYWKRSKAAAKVARERGKRSTPGGDSLPSRL